MDIGDYNSMTPGAKRGSTSVLLVSLLIFIIDFILDYGNMGTSTSYVFATKGPAPNALIMHHCLEPTDFHSCGICEIGYDKYLDTDSSNYCYSIKLLIDLIYNRMQ
jgi:hypothetical protein